jgi:hypothetical protein
VLGRAVDSDQAKIRRGIQPCRLLARNAAGSDKYDLSGTLGLHLLGLRGEVESLLQVQRCDAGLGSIDGEMNLGAVRFEEQRGRGENVGANHHDAIGGRQRVHIIVGSQARSINEPGLAEARGHPCGGIENQHVIARGARGRSQAKLGDGQKKQQHAD